MEGWRKAWRNGVEPLLSDNALQVLRDALVNDDPRLLQGRTTMPVAFSEWSDFPIEGACALGYSAWQDEGLTTVGEIIRRFRQLGSEIEKRLGEHARCGWWLVWFDETPRQEMRREMLAELDIALNRRTKEVTSGSVAENMA